MLMLRPLSICLVAILSIHQVFVLGADEGWQLLHLQNQAPDAEITDFVVSIVDSSPEQTASCLKAAIKQNNIKAVEWLLDYADQHNDIAKRLKEILGVYSIVGFKLSYVLDDDYDELTVAKLAVGNLMVKDGEASAIDIGYLLGFRRLTMTLIEWKWKNIDNRAESIWDISQRGISRFFDLNGLYDGKNTLLQAACLAGNLNVINLLVDNPELDINSKGKSGMSPIHIALLWNFSDVAKALLLRKDLDMNVKDNEGNTPLHIACIKNQLGLAEDLLSRETGLMPGWTQMIVKILVEQEISYNEAPSRNVLNVSAKNNAGNSPLHCACVSGSLGIIKLLLNDRFKINLNCQNNAGKTPIELALGYENWNIVSHLLITSGNEVNVSDIVKKFGYDIMQYACKNGDLKVVELLLDEKFKGYMKANYQYKKGSTFLDLAMNSKKWDIVVFLLSQKDLLMEKDRSEVLFYSFLSKDLVEVVKALLHSRRIELKSIDFITLLNWFQETTRPPKLKINLFLDALEHFLELGDVKVNDILNSIPYEALLEPHLDAYEIGERLAKIFEAKKQSLLQGEKSTTTFLEYQRYMFEQAIKYLESKILASKQDGFEVDSASLLENIEKSKVSIKDNKVMSADMDQSLANKASTIKQEAGIHAMSENANKVFANIFQSPPIDSAREFIAKLMETRKFLQGHDFLIKNAERDGWINHYSSHYPWIWSKVAEAEPFFSLSATNPIVDKMEVETGLNENKRKAANKRRREESDQSEPRKRPKPNNY